MGPSGVVLYDLSLPKLVGRGARTKTAKVWRAPYELCQLYPYALAPCVVGVTRAPYLNECVPSVTVCSRVRVRVSLLLLSVSVLL